jgi:nicotinate dehydrogenase subunit B
LEINREGIADQVEDGAIQGLSWALKEQAIVDTHIVTSRGWFTHPTPTFQVVPKMDVVMLDRPNQPVKGFGKSVTVPVVAAVMNTVHDAKGAYVRDLPMTPDRVKSALASA